MIQEYLDAVYSALHKDLPGIEYRRNLESKENDSTRRPYERDLCSVVSFPQAWGSTALGFGGIGGQAMTSALTVVVTMGNTACVYFGGGLAYTIEKPNRKFHEDLAAQSMNPVSRKTQYWDKSK